jgi:hypothetical protein
MVAIISKAGRRLGKGGRINQWFLSVQNEKVDNLIHPADQLASAIMGTASMVKLKTGNAELEIDPRKLKKTRKEIEAN